MDEAVTFRETQRFRQPWLFALLGAAGVVSVVASAGGGLMIIAGVAMLFWFARLTTEVRGDGVYVRFSPFHRSFRRLPWTGIDRCERREFGLMTYGGIGIRWTPNAIAYMTRRGDGVAIERTDAKTVVIGTQHPERLVTAISDGIGTEPKGGV